MKAKQNSKTPKKPLSAKAIEGMKFGDADKSDVGENEGLRVRCCKDGTKTFSYRYKSPETKKLVTMKIGKHPDMSLAEARFELEKLKAVRRSGVCPKAEIERRESAVEQERLEQEHQQELESFTVEDLVELYLTEFIEDRWVVDRRNPDKKKKIPGARKPKGQAETRRTLHGDAVRVLGHFPASEVTRKMVVSMVKDIVDRGANVQAGNVLRELSSAYEYAIGLERFPDEFANPALLAKASLKQAKVRLTSVKGTRALNDADLKKVLAWLPGSGYSATQKKVIWFALWTGCRTGEVCAAEWKDVDLDKGVWFLKGTKNGTDRDVQLSRQAVVFLQGLKVSTNDCLFPSNRTGTPIQQKSLSETKWQLKNPDRVKNRRRFTESEQWLDTVEDWSPHDLRRTVRTGLSRLGCPSEVAEAVLGHSRKGIEGTYDLHGYEAECSVWLQKWADHLDCLQHLCLRLDQIEFQWLF